MGETYTTRFACWRSDTCGDGQIYTVVVMQLPPRLTNPDNRPMSDSELQNTQPGPNSDLQVPVRPKGEA